MGVLMDNAINNELSDNLKTSSEKEGFDINQWNSSQAVHLKNARERVIKRLITDKAYYNEFRTQSEIAKQMQLTKISIHSKLHRIFIESDINKFMLRSICQYLREHTFLYELNYLEDHKIDTSRAKTQRATSELYKNNKPNDNLEHFNNILKFLDDDTHDVKTAARSIINEFNHILDSNHESDIEFMRNFTECFQ